MIGKRVKVNDYKFIYGQETVFINIYGAFKNKKNGNKYAIYSYENNNKISYGTFFQRDKEAVIMTAKEDPKEIIKEFMDSIINGEKKDNFEIISLDNIETIQIIDEHTNDFNIDIKKLNDLTIPKPIEERVIKEPKKKKQIYIGPIFFGIFIIVVILFFFVNPEVLLGDNKHYSCMKSYTHKSLPSSVTEEIMLTFNRRKKITDIDINTDYIFSDTNNYEEFKNKGRFYQYMEEGDTYKFIDENRTYRLFSSINVDEEYFLPTEESELIKYYQDKKYTCKVVNIDE